MEWIDIKEKPPKETGRYLVSTTCNHFAHKLLAWDYPHPCGEVNIAYYNLFGKWHYASNLDWDPKVEITHWMEIPPLPREKE